jgi:hypothetical protein
MLQKLILHAFADNIGPDMARREKEDTSFNLLSSSGLIGNTNAISHLLFTPAQKAALREGRIRTQGKTPSGAPGIHILHPMGVRVRVRFVRGRKVGGLRPKRTPASISTVPTQSTTPPKPNTLGANQLFCLSLKYVSELGSRA